MTDAMAAGRYCSLCGGHLWHIDRPLREPYFWTAYVCSVRKPDRVDSGRRSSVTTAVRIRGADWVAVPDGDQANHADNEALNDPWGPGILTGVGLMDTFLCHHLCWELLKLQITGTSQRPPDPMRIGSLLFDVLNSTPWGRDGDPIPENGYHGAIIMRHSVEGHQFLNTDPNRPFPPEDVPTFSLKEHGPAVASSNFRIRPLGPLSHTDPFYKLPDEILQVLLSHLPIKDLPSARLASRRLGILGAIDNLPQSFWASRFRASHEIGCLYGILVPLRAVPDWFWSYFYCEWSLRHEAGADGLRNRHRIWRCLSDLSAVLNPLLNSEGGNQLDTSTFLWNHSLTQRVSSPELPRLRTRENPEQPIQLGVRLQNEHKMFICGEGYDGRVKIEFSSIVLSSAEYISGYRVSVQHPDDGPRGVQQAGLMIASALTTIFLDPGDKISYVDVYISTSGIHCLKFFIAKSEGEIRIHSVGKPRRRHGIIAIKRLTPESPIVGFKFGFDMYKAVAIQLIENTCTIQDLEVAPAALWNLAILPDGNQDLTALPIPTPHERSVFPVNIYMPFGGLDGSGLSSLCSITALVHGTAGICGLRFTYSAGEPVLYGQREFMEPNGRLVNCVEQTLLVDGKNGERVIQLAPGSKLRRHGSAENIVARTNFNQFCVFGPFDGSDLKYDQVLPSKPSAIVAVVALVSAPGWNFQDLQSQHLRAPCLPRPHRAAPYSSSFETAGPASAVAPWMNQKEGSCFTTASLERVRRIRISRGTDNRSRSGSHISGLWIEYYGGWRDAILGQWIEETACVVLEYNERIIDFTIWATKEVGFGSPMLRLGKISGIEIGTTRNRVVLRQMPPQMGDQTCVRYYATPFEDVVFVTWAFNSRMDDIQVRLKPKPLLAQKTLAFCHTERKPRPIDLSDGQGRSYFEFVRSDFDVKSIPSHELSARYHCPRNTYFFEDVDSNGRPVRLTRIDMSRDQGGNISGLAFHYENHKVVQQGTLNDGRVSLHLDLGKNERISLLLVYEKRSSKRGLEFRSNLGQTIRVARQNRNFDSLTVFALDPAAQFPDPFSLHPKVTVDALILNKFPTVDGNRKPIESCVGIWTVSRHTRPGRGLELDFADIGPIFISRNN